MSFKNDKQESEILSKKKRIKDIIKDTVAT